VVVREGGRRHGAEGGEGCGWRQIFHGVMWGVDSCAEGCGIDHDMVAVGAGVQAFDWRVAWSSDSSSVVGMVRWSPGRGDVLTLKV